MHSILLVEDEVAVRKSIVDLTPWEKHGFLKPLEASNGLEAIEIMEERMPDVLITDIKMPYMDGIELIKRVRSEYSASACIVVLSGFDEFTYAQAAVELKVAEYVLKPVTVEGMEGLLERIKKHIEDERKLFMEGAGKADPLYKEAFSLYKEKQLSALIDGSGGAEDIVSLGFSSNDRLFCLAVVEGMDDMAEANAIWDGAISQREGKKPISFSHEGQLMLIFTSTMKDEFSQLFFQQTCRALNLYADSINRYAGRGFHIGIGRVKAKLEGIKDSYREAIEALNYCSLYPEQRIIAYSDVENMEAGRNSEKTIGSRSDFVLSLKFGTKDDVSSVVHKAFSSLSPKDEVEGTVLSLLFDVSETLKEYGIEMSALTEDGESVFSRLSHIKSFSSAEKFCREVAVGANSLLFGAREKSRIRFVENAKREIMRRYSDPLFGLESLCESISVSPEYFSTTFKKETGVSFVQFLTGARLEKAKELLRTTDEKSYEIASKVGFSDPNYFSFSFKRNVGLSPSQYRAEARK